MAQISKITTAHQPVDERMRRMVATGLAAAILAAAFVGLLALDASHPTSITAPSTARGDLVDGWMPAAAGAEAQRLGGVQDGYLPGLIGAQRSSDLVDGWMPVFNTTNASDLRDGWESQLVR